MLKLLATVSFFLFSIISIGQQPSKSPDFNSLWKNVEEAESKGLPETFLKIVDQIYNKAKAENNDVQLVKAVIHRIKYSKTEESDELAENIKNLERECNQSVFPVKPLFHSMLAETYWNYYRRNRYRFSNRSNTVDFKNDDISTWSLEKIIEKTSENLRNSLLDSDRLKNIKIDIYDQVLVAGNKQGRALRPTLFDFLAHRAVDFYMNDEPAIVRPSYYFTINSADYLLGAEEFITKRIVSPDSFSFKLKTLQILQDLTRFHINDKNPEPLIEVDLKRLTFVREYLTLQNKEELYLKALEKLEEKYSKLPISGEILVRIAQIWAERGRSYKPLQSEAHKWDIKKAYDICQEVIRRFPNSNGANMAYNFSQGLMEKSISSQIEEVNVPNQPFRALVSYKNFNTLYWRIVPVTHDEVRSERKKWQNNYNVDREEKFLEHFLAKTSIKSGIVNLPTDGDLQQHSTEVKIEGAPEGDYMVLFSPEKDFGVKFNSLCYVFTTISNLSFIQRNTDAGNTDIYVLNRTSGEPVEGAIAQIYNRKYNNLTGKYETKMVYKLTSDKEGFITVPYITDNRPNYHNNSFLIDITYKNDKISSRKIDEYDDYSNGTIWQNQKQNTPAYTHTVFFMDRAIYRPGQTLYFKGLVFKSDGKKPEIVTQSKYTVTFLDVNSQVVAKKEVVTNEYGSFSGTFTTPSSGLTGQMYLQIDDSHSSNIYFSVEEYKRPKFETSFNPIEGSFRLNEKIKVTGKASAYSGAVIDGASVKYRVVRNAHFPYWWWCWYGYYPSSPEVEITNGTTVSGVNGEYSIEFTALPDESVDKKSDPIFTYTVYADVTDINGETHSTQAYIDVAYKALIVGVNAYTIDKSSENKESYNFLIDTKNLAGQFEPAAGEIKIWKLKDPGRVYRNRLWEQPDKFTLSEADFRKSFPNDLYSDEGNYLKWPDEKEVLKIGYNTAVSKELSLQNVLNWKTGKYKFEITSKDKYGEDVKESGFFDVIDSKDKAMSLPELFQMSVINSSCEPGDTVKAVLGSSEKILVLFEVELDGKIINKQTLKINNEKRVISIPILEAYRGGIALHCAFIKNNRPYTRTENIYIPFSNKLLNISFETFRDKLMPGQEEQWKLKISGPKSDKIMAEMVATLYDASLDEFRANYWGASFFYANYARLNWNAYLGFNSEEFRNHNNEWFTYKSKDVITPDYDALNWFGLDIYGWDETRFRYYKDGPVRRVAMKSLSGVMPGIEVEVNDEMKVAEADEMLAPVSQLSDMVTVGYATNKKAETAYKPETSKPDFGEVKVRKNFSETAFFYPFLQTNEQGEIIINFTIPEALTRWKMLGFAHTKDLKSGTVTNELVTQKDLMVVPNQPRFFRENDKMVFSAKITSLTDSLLDGTARLEFFDALTMEPIDNLMGNQNNLKNFKISGKQSTSLEWNIEIPEGVQVISYKIVAKAGNFSDGEEMTLPVVTNRMLVTETLPLTIRGNQTKTFTLEKLAKNTSATLKNQRYTLEFTSNPAWYAVQALPYLMEYPYECTEQTFSRFYANSIASHIANSNPKIKKVFDTWSAIQPDALLSNLEKNQELKTALLEETPWVLNAKDESQRKRSVALLFDLNLMANEQERAQKKILDAQSANGGFAWFPGFKEDRYITQHIVAGFGHLDAMGVTSIRTDKNTWPMVKKAIAYIDSKLDESYQYLKAEAKRKNINLNDNHLGYFEVHYLYARSYFMDVKVPNEYSEAYTYFLGQAKKYWLQHSLYMQGMIALTLHRNSDVATPATIIKSLRERALNNEEMGMYWKYDRGYSWYQAPIETHALMIEVFDEIAKDNKAVDDLKTWLLKQKQTQDWQTTKATSEACYALLRRGTDMMATESQVEIKVGDELIDPAKRPDIKTEAGTGYFKTAWTASEITNNMGNIRVTKKDNGVAWGAVYWQYFEQLDKITSAETPLKLKKQLFLQQNTEHGPVIVPVTDTTILKVGDLVKVRIELRTDRTMEYIHLKDMRAAGFEPTETISTSKYQDGLYYYESPRDLATNFFIGWLPKGTYVFEYSLRASQKGNFSNGVTSIQCMYAPEFSSHSEGVRVKID